MMTYSILLYLLILEIDNRFLVSMANVFSELAENFKYMTFQKNLICVWVNMKRTRAKVPRELSCPRISHCV